LLISHLDPSAVASGYCRGYDVGTNIEHVEKVNSNNIENKSNTHDNLSYHPERNQEAKTIIKALIRS